MSLSSRLLAILTLAVLSASACNQGKRVAAWKDTPVIIISIDTLRSDHLPAYGYKGVATPAIDALRNDSVLFEHAYSNIPLTLPSHAALFTGRLPADTAVRDNVGFRLSAETPTIAEELKKNGYETGGAVSSFVLRRQTGIARGFDFYDDGIALPEAQENMGLIQREGQKTVAAATRWIGERAGNRFFFFLHLYEPHAPYTPPPEFRSGAATDYDGEIAYVDDILGGFLRFLKERDLYDKALIIFTSDHGEGLGDHGEEEHGIFLYREAIQIPLLIKLPGRARAGESVAEPVQLIDLFPTIADLTKTATKPVDPSSRSLAGNTLGAKRKIFSETYYPRLHFGWSELHSLIDEQYHLIDAPRAELYDVVSDTRERKNIAAEQRRVYAGMKRLVEPLVKQASAPTRIDPEEADKLAALGYIGSAVTSPDDVLPDPKDQIAVLGDIKACFALFHAAKYEEALAASKSLLKRSPRILDLWHISARALTKLGREEEAMAVAKEGLRLAPGTTYFQLMIANLALELRLLDEAVEYATMALEEDPGRGHEVLARVRLEKNDIDGAVREANLALKEQSDGVGPLLILSRAASRRGDPATALGYADKAQALLLEKNAPVTVSVHYQRGDALARLGRFDEAERAFLEEIRLFPDEPQSYVSLILAYISQGRTKDATRLVFDLTRQSPTPRSYVAMVQTLRTIGDEKGARYWMDKALLQFPDDPRIRELNSGEGTSAAR
ncbi:MAG TPA: sulfatase-like hydrolase/transferase [Thermoanaerobaculia bacterium]|nr:sulfatase-like hydrolase/transferase [Thermoanaerobaculia bacterium]